MHLEMHNKITKDLRNTQIAAIREDSGYCFLEYILSHKLHHSVEYHSIVIRFYGIIAIIKCQY